jgi:aldehyde dehydrogenase (NAD+)
MRDYLGCYIDGKWTGPGGGDTISVVNPATEAVAGRISNGTAADVDDAVTAATRALAAFSQTTVGERVVLLERIVVEFERRVDDMADAVTEEMGAPRWLARKAHAARGIDHLRTALQVLGTYSFQEIRGSTALVKEPIGVCALITPWNWPVNQIACKVAPAIATGCTMVLKPSEVAPFSAWIWAEIMDAAGVPAGVFNLINGDGPSVGVALTTHPGIDMVSFTGSTRAGVAVAQNAASTVKRVHQELGGKSPHIILDDADFEEAVERGVAAVMLNSGQSCNAPTRMLVPADRMEDAVAIAQLAVGPRRAGDPLEDAFLGPVASKAQWDKVQALIARGVEEGARLIAGGPGKPDRLDTGYYVKPTVFADVDPHMQIAREEIFGPVLSILAYRDIDHAVEVANDTPYGLAAYVSGGDPETVRGVAARLRAGQVNINGAAVDLMAPFGGYKMSGNGREWGDHAFGEFLETKAILGYAA